MPSTSQAQARLMRAVAHGWHPSKFKGPSKSVAEDFVAADKGKSIKKLPKRKSSMPSASEQAAALRGR